MFGVFLFLTFYMQQTRGFSPITTGLAFLPMTAVIMVTAVISTTKLSGRFGPRALIVTGMLLGVAGMASLTQLGMTSSYLTAILPALLVMGVGMGLVFSSAMYGATLGVRPSDAGVASATVTAAQQVGGSVGTALLSTLAASAATNYVHGHLASVAAAGGTATAHQALIAHAAIHGYTVGFAASGAMFVVGAIVGALTFERGARREQVASDLVMAH
jgi:hypothetical protein